VSGGIGFLSGRLSSADVRAIIEKLITLFREQGPYAFYALLITVLFGGLTIWLISKLLHGKDEEIVRISGQRDRFEQLFIDDWKTTRKELATLGRARK
jgi:hypothetical protein